MLRSVDLVMVLTSRDHTLQLGGCEAIAEGKPLITSDWPYLREVFHRGTVFVPNTTEGISDGIRKAFTSIVDLQCEALVLRQERRELWNVQLKHLHILMA